MSSLFSIDSPLWRLSMKLLHFLWLSILWFICCIPLITIGASTTALYSITLKYVKNEEGYLTKAFFHSLKQNFKQASIIWAFLFLVGFFLGINLIIYTRSTRTGFIPMLLTTVFFSLSLAFILVNIYVYAVLAKFDNSIPHTLKNAVIMALCHWPSSICMLAIYLLWLSIGLLYFPPLLFFAPAGCAYVNSLFFTRLFIKHTPPPAPQSPQQISAGAG